MRAENSTIFINFKKKKRKRKKKKKKNGRQTNTELRSCVKVEVAVPGFPSLIILMVSVDVKRH